MRNAPRLSASAAVSARRRGAPARGVAEALVWALVCGASLGCGPSVPFDSEGPECGPVTMAPGEAAARRVECSDEIPAGGEGRTGDFILQNDRLVAVIRNPWEALTLLDTPGGTLVDLVPVGEVDPLREAVGLIDGAWIEAADYDWGTDADGAWFSLSGPAAPLPGAADGVEPVERSLTWRLPRDAEWIVAEGAEQLYLHANDGAALTDDGSDEVSGGASAVTGLAAGGLRLMGAGGIDADLGGAVILAGSTLIAGGADAALSARWPDGVPVAGACAGQRVEVLVDGEVIAWLEATFEARVPAEASLRCVGEGYAPGDPASPDVGLLLRPGEGAWVRATITDADGAPLRARLDLEGPGLLGGRSLALPPEEALLALGPGSFQASISAGPTYEPWSGELDSPGRRLEVALERRIDAEGWALVDIDRRPAPDPASRQTPDEDLALAAAEGVAFAVQAPGDEVGTPFVTSETSGLLRYEGGSRAQPTGAGAVISWPWDDNRKWSGHGAVQWSGLEPEAVVALAAQGDRRVAVDVDWLSAAGAPHTWFPAPDLVMLRGLEDLGAYVDVLESGYRPAVAGPLIWTPAETSSLPSVAACERGLLTGLSVATTGPLLEIAALDPAPLTLPLHTGRRIGIRLQATDAAQIEAVQIWADGALVEEIPVGEALQVSDAEGGGDSSGLRLDGAFAIQADRWVLAVASGPAEWAVTSPVWFDDSSSR